MKKKVCKKCKIFFEEKENECQICKGNQYTTNWQGRVYILDVNKSVIGKKISAPQNGEYAIKAR